MEDCDIVELECKIAEYRIELETIDVCGQKFLNFFSERDIDRDLDNK